MTDCNLAQHKLLPNSNTDGSMAALQVRGRPLPVVYVLMDNEKIDHNLIKDRIVTFVPEERILFKRGNETVYR